MRLPTVLAGPLSLGILEMGLELDWDWEDSLAERTGSIDKLTIVLDHYSPL